MWNLWWTHSQGHSIHFRQKLPLANTKATTNNKTMSRIDSHSRRTAIAAMWHSQIPDTNIPNCFACYIHMQVRSYRLKMDCNTEQQAILLNLWTASWCLWMWQNAWSIYNAFLQSNNNGAFVVSPDIVSLSFPGANTVILSVLLHVLVN